MTSLRQTRVLPAVDSSVGAVVDVLKRGGLVALPTETVYGLAGRGLDDDVVRAIYAAKGRPSDNPVILHVGDAAAARPLWAFSDAGADDGVDDGSRARAEVLMKAFWPGPLTIVAEASVVVPPVPRAGLSKVAVRVPAHAFARAVADALGEPFAAPSANLSGRPSPTNADDVLRTLDGRIDLVVDGGPCAAGIESSVVDVTGARPRLLRPGALSLLELRRFLPDLDVRAPGRAAHTDDASPGLRHRHYAPSVPASLVADLGDVWGDESVFVIVDEDSYEDAVAEFGARGSVVVLPAEPDGYARGLYAALYAAERAQPKHLVIKDVGVDDAWAAVRDRLLRATS